MSETPLVPLVLNNLGDIETSELRALTNAAFHGLAQVPAEAAWFAKLNNPGTQR